MNVTEGSANTKVTFKTCAPFQKCRPEINETFVDDTNFINIAMPMYNLIEYSDNYSDISGSLWNFKNDETGGDDDFTVDNNHIPNKSSSFKYKSSFITGKDNVKIAVPLKYYFINSNFWRSLEFSLKWIENCILSSAGTAAIFQ